MKLTGLLAMLSGIVLLAACSKSSSDDSYNNLSAKGKLLVDGKWQITAITATTFYMGKDTTADIYATTEECDKDDFTIFRSNGTGCADENTNKCTKDQQTECGTWYLLDSDTKIALIDSNPDTFALVGLTSTQFKLQLTKPNSSGVPVHWEYTYKNIK